MPGKSKQPSERTIDRRGPTLPGLRGYVLSSAAYDRLVAQGIDPETVTETELARRAKSCLTYDDQGRIIQVVARYRRPKSVTYFKTDQ